MSKDIFQKFLTEKFGEGAYAEVNLETNRLEFFSKNDINNDVNADAVNSIVDFMSIKTNIENWDSTYQVLHALYTTP